MTKPNNSVNEAVILAGGIGSRMGTEFSFTQKCLLPVGGRPILSYVINSLSKAGIKKIFVIVNHFSSDVITYLSETTSFEIEIITKTIKSSSTTEVLKNLNGDIKDNFVYVHGNIIFPEKWVRQLIHNFDDKFPALFGVSKIDLISTHIHVMGKNRNVEKIIMPNGNPPPSNTLCGIELTLFTKDIFNIIENSRPSQRLGNALINAKWERNYKFKYQLLEGMWAHIETPIDLKRASTIINQICDY